MDNKQPLTIGIVAGEISGDALGADFMHKMNAIHPNIRWVGVGGNQMAKAGLISIIDMRRLSVMGLTEVIKHLPDLILAKRQILGEFHQAGIDIFVGIDAPDFNLRLGKVLKSKGIFCVQYVSPSVWAWRENRIHGIKQATDLVLCLFPFELDVYQRHHHPAVCVGHPLLNTLTADERKLPIIRQEFFKRHHLPIQANPNHPTICVMAGSRLSEINAILPLLAKSMLLIAKSLPNCHFVLPVVSQEHADYTSNLLHKHANDIIKLTHIICQADTNNTLTTSQTAMNASDIILLASGTATLEAQLLERPMVVVYKISPISYAIAKRLVKTPYVALPNILSNQQKGCAIVPELIQENAEPKQIAEYALIILNDTNQAQRQKLHQLNTWLRQESTANPAVSTLNYYGKFCHE
ncbi:lipid-A-disaccharide synthase [Moraxella nasovis]|uniref:lipid-A-disaccharide synthase n=1 Tax=Moraxella nasovis TaxID=2904121 RepID=UPI001F620733|nr:lipid-A-disaccharide synthase [Moraxella nasovis]UNU73549.1 lipid-A-disaccharide synthase [Moraxella nasovis]